MSRTKTICKAVIRAWNLTELNWHLSSVQFRTLIAQLRCPNKIIGISYFGASVGTRMAGGLLSRRNIKFATTVARHLLPTRWCKIKWKNATDRPCSLKLFPEIMPNSTLRTPSGIVRRSEDDVRAACLLWTLWLSQATNKIWLLFFTVGPTYLAGRGIKRFVTRPFRMATGHMDSLVYAQECPAAPWWTADTSHAVTLPPQFGFYSAFPVPDEILMRKVRDTKSSIFFGAVGYTIKSVQQQR